MGSVEGDEGRLQSKTWSLWYSSRDKNIELFVVVWDVWECYMIIL